MASGFHVIAVLCVTQQNFGFCMVRRIIRTLPPLPFQDAGSAVNIRSAIPLDAYVTARWRT
jgi:hypothetical protein